MQDQMNSAMASAKEVASSMTERVSDFFQGNPFTTPVGRKIELATDASALATENWGLNMEICDFINSTAEGGRDAIRAIRKRLYTQMSKNNAVVMFTLTVLETCVKNCDTRFHELVCQKDFISELVRLIGPKFDAPQVVQERVLCLIQSWNDAFRNDPRLQGVCQVYDELKAKGVQFPITDSDSKAPILTPKRNCELHYFADPSQPVQPTSEQLEKLRKELDIVNVNLKVMRELLSEMAPGKENPDDFQLAVDLHTVLKQMHARIQDLIRTVQNDEVMYELLVLNDDFNNLFEKYNRFMLNRASGTNENVSTVENNLIELGGQTLDQQLSALEISNAPNIASKQDHASASGTVGGKDVPVNDREAAEMAQWLEAQEGKMTTRDSTNLLSSAKPKEHDALLQGKAAASGDKANAES